jgi:glycosyltransferase involved in cell wall biosynthesis
VKKLAILQPYLPECPFFVGLVAVPAVDGIQCRVPADEADEPQKHRGDAAIADCFVGVSARELFLADRSAIPGVVERHLPAADAVVVSQIGASWDTNRTVLNGIIVRIRVGLWEHIKSCVTEINSLNISVECCQLRNAHHVFGHRPAGAAHALQCGVRVMAVINTVPTDRLVAVRGSRTSVDVAESRTRHGLLGRPVLGYIGALDHSKKVGLLAEALDVVWRENPSVRILVAGRGALEGLLAPAVERGQVILLGYADADAKALLAAVSSALLDPGRIGLVAVDALVLGRPILTTPYPFHAPEVEYLLEGESVFAADMSPAAFADLMLEAAHWANVQSNWDFPTMPNMVENFSQGCIELLES